MAQDDVFDLFVIGGGINGAGIACDASGRGLKVGLAEMGDFAGATSSSSTKLIHGGLRYLEYYEFRLVREALAEREVLLRKAPHIIWPLRFVLPHEPHLRPAWMIRIGLFLYDHIGGKMSLPKSKAVSLDGTEWGIGLKPQYHKGFVYSDCWVDDARLVIFNIMMARDKGARIFARQRVTAARRNGDIWEIDLEDVASGAKTTQRARGLVNAAGPWVRQLFGHLQDVKPGNNVRLVKGSHIVVPRQHPGKQAFILQNKDNRIVFVIPYERDFTLIGTTDIPYEGEPHAVKITPEEVDYLCAIASDYLAKPVAAKDVVWTYSGVRPLYDDGSADPSAVTRDYVFELDRQDAQNGAGTPLLSIYGGKITTYRELAERALDKLKPFYPAMGPAWTSKAPLPGGAIPNGDFEAFVADLVARYRAVPPDLLRALARRHGSNVDRVLEGVGAAADLGQHFGGQLYAREIEYFMREEWAVEPQDVLFRRSKEGLHMTQAAREDVAEWMATRKRNTPV